MNDALAHRGPDGDGVFIDEARVGLGHRRLSILDLSDAGSQPMFNEDRSLALVFNGEIYNYLELMPELKAAGHVFRSQSDSEVILHAYEQWGADCVRRFNGMWAFALWDRRAQQLFVSRDRFGVKPFYFHQSPQAFSFSSEPAGLKAAGCMNFGLDHRWKALGQNFGSGFNVNYVPPTRVQQTENLRRDETARRQFDAYLSWSSGSVRDGINWRLSFANLVPRDAQVTSEAVTLDPVTGHTLVTDSWSRNKTFRVVSLRADLRF